jgi:hypothetical protein
MTFKILKEKIDTLERTLLAIDSVNNICQESILDGQKIIDLENCAYLLNHLIEPAMLQVEEVRMMFGMMFEKVANISGEANHVSD